MIEAKKPVNLEIKILQGNKPDKQSTKPVIDHTGEFNLANTHPFDAQNVVFSLGGIGVASTEMSSPDSALNRTSGSGLHTRACGC